MLTLNGSSLRRVRSDTRLVRADLDAMLTLAGSSLAGLHL